MVAFVQRMEMVFVASADARGECDASLRAGPPGFVRVLDARTLAYPEYRGNGVHASLGNISENAHVGLLMVDFVQDLIGLHVNGTARIVEAEDFAGAFPGMPQDLERGRRAERWVVVDVDEAYVHCRSTSRAWRACRRSASGAPTTPAARVATTSGRRRRRDGGRAPCRAQAVPQHHAPRWGQCADVAPR